MLKENGFPLKNQMGRYSKMVADSFHYLERAADVNFKAITRGKDTNTCLIPIIHR